MTEQFTSFSARMAHTVEQKTEATVGKERYPFSELPVGRSFTRPLDQANVKSMRARAAQLAKTGKRFIVLVFKDLGVVEVGRLPDAAKDPLTRMVALAEAESTFGVRCEPNATVPLRTIPSYITSTPVNDLPETGMTPWAMASAAKQAASATQAAPAATWPAPAFVPAPAPAPAPAPFPTYAQAAPAGFAGIPATLLHLTAAAAHEAHVKAQYQRFGVTSFDEMTDAQIAEAQKAVEAADAAWEASNVKPTKFPDPAKMSFDAKKTKPTAPAERTPEQIAKYNNRPIPSEEEVASIAALAEAGRLRWLAQKAEDEKNPQPKSTSW